MQQQSKAVPAVPSSHQPPTLDQQALLTRITKLAKSRVTYSRVYQIHLIIAIYYTILFTLINWDGEYRLSSRSLPKILNQKNFKLEKLTMWTDPAREIEQNVKIQEIHFETNPVPTDTDILDTFSSLTHQQMLSQNEDGHPTVNHPSFELDENTLRSLQQFIESQGLHHTTHPSEQSANLSDSTPGLKSETTLAEGIAQHYLPTRTEVKAETEEERRARALRVRQENRERKKRWREQNTDRNKDNDLRCRVNKRANIIFGAHSSPQKTLYVENEFKKRQSKRRGRAPSPSGDEFDSPENMYAALLNNPEFSNVLMQLLAQKGVDSSAQFVELLRSNPDFVRGILPSAPATEETQEQFNVVTSEIQYSIVGQTSTYDETQSSHLDLQSQLTHPDLVTLETDNHDNIITEHSNIMHSLPAPIPRVGAKTEDTTSSVAQPPLPVLHSHSPIPNPQIPRAVTQVPAQLRPSQDRIRALGFPPMPPPPPPR